MRRSVAIFAAIGIVAAAIAAVVGLWLPARSQRLDAGWIAAGERALAQASLPSQYSIDTRDGRIQVCSNGASERCFLGPGDPAAQIAPVKVALADMATGPMHASCSPVPQPNAPASCRLFVPVAGSRLAVELFAHPVEMRGPPSQWTYSGAYVLIHVDER
jgi:hypothetical protein